MIAHNSVRTTLNLENSPESLEPDPMIDILASRSLPTIQQELNQSDLSEHQPSAIDLDEYSFNQDRLELGLAPQTGDDVPLGDVEIDESGLSDYVIDEDEEELAAALLDQDVEMVPYGATTSAPGSEEKVRVLISRYAQGHPLWHQDDESRLEGYNREDQGLAPRKISQKEPVVVSEEDKLLLWSSRHKKAKQEAALQDKRSSNSSLQANIGTLQSSSDLQQPSRVRENDFAVAKAVREPSRLGSNPRSSDWTTNGNFGQNQTQQTGLRIKSSRHTSAVRPKAEQPTAETARARTQPTNAPKDDIKQQYEMLVKAVASGGLAQSDLTSFIKNHGDKLSKVGIEA